jgi:hypothetical protein
MALPVIGPVLGIVFGKRGLRNIERDPELDGAGLAQAGIVVGWVGMIISLIIVVLAVVAVSALFFPGDASVGIPVRVSN